MIDVPCRGATVHPQTVPMETATMILHHALQTLDDMFTHILHGYIFM